MKKVLVYSLLFVTIFGTVGLSEALTIAVDSILREAQIFYEDPVIGYTTVGPTSSVMGVFDETVTVTETYPEKDNSYLYAEVDHLSNVTNTGTYLEVTASGYTDIYKEVSEGYFVPANTTSDLYLTFTVDDTAYYYYSVSSTDMGWFGIESTWTDIHFGDGTYYGVLSADSYYFDIGAWTTGGPHEEYEGRFIVSANPIPPIPEPTTILLLGFGLVGLAAFRRTSRERG